MPLPGAEINILDVAAPPGTVTDTGLLIALGETERGPLEPTEINSYNDLTRIFGARQPYGILHDTLEVAFATGLARAIVARVVADTAVAASKSLNKDATPAIVVTANAPGAWGNTLRVAVIDQAGARRLVVTTTDGVTLEQSPYATTQAELVSWGQAARYVTVTAGTDPGIPDVAAAAALTGGNDDRATIDQADYTAALDRITAEHGTGQLAAPGATSEAIHLALLEKAADPQCQRFAVLDGDPTMDASALTVHANTLTAEGNGQWGTLVAPRVRVGTGSGSRLVPASGFWAGRAAFTDATVGVGQPPAGENYGESQSIVDIETVYTDSEREALNQAGVIVVARVNRAPRIYGAVTLADIDAHPAYRWVNGTRAVIRYRALANTILERYVLRRVDGKRQILVELSNDLTGLSEQERAANNLFGETPADAYRVDTRYPTVNTDQTLADGYLIANVEIRTPPVAERVRLDIAVRAPGDQIASL